MTFGDRNLGWQEDLAVSEEALFFNLSIDLLAIVKGNGYFHRVNFAWTRTLGYSEAELLAQPLTELVHPEDRPTTLVELERLKTGIPTDNFDHRYRAKDGSYRWLSWSATPHPQRQEFYCIARDVTRQREMAHALRAAQHPNQPAPPETTPLELAQRIHILETANRSLRDREMWFRAALDHIPDVFVIYDPQRRIQFINAAGPPLTHRPVEDFLGRTDEEIHPPEVTSAYLPLLLRAVETKQYQTGECTITLPGSATYTIVVQYVPLLNGQGDIRQILGITHDITARKDTEAALARSEDHNRALLAAIPDLMVRIGIDGIYRGSVAERREFDLLPPSLDKAGVAMADVLPPDLAQRKLHYLRQAFETGEVQVFEQQVQNGDRLQYEEVRAVRCGVDEVLFIIRDISEQKQAAADRLATTQIHQELSLLEDIFDLILAGYWDWDIPGHREYYSSGFKRMLGYADHELPNAPGTWQQLIFPEDLPDALARLEQHFASRGQEPYYHEVRYRHKDGSTVWVICSGQVIEWDDDGHPLRMIGCHVNISDRKGAEIQLSASEEKFRNFVEHVNAIIYTLSPGGEFTYVSPSWKTILGHGINEVVGQSFLPFVHPEDRDRCLEFLHNIVAEGGTQSGPEYRVRHKHGEWRWHASQGTPQRDQEGQVVGYLGVAYDITARKQAEARLHQANQALERATRLKDEFLANMSHELRTPLNAILGMSEGLQEGVFGSLNERQIKALRTIESSGTHLLALINDILDLSKIEAGRVELNLAPMDLRQLCWDSLAFVQQQAMKKRLKLDLDLPSPLPVPCLDERRIRQVLINLLMNAVKFTPEGGRITLAVSWDNPCTSGSTVGFLHLSVTDTGIGIAPENLSGLFEPFIQIDSALNRKYEGTGLGLALVKHIVELHGGQVAVSSEVNRGSCFRVDLPYSFLDSSPPMTTPRGMLPPCNEPDGEDGSPGGPLILLAEDNEANILTLCSYLEAKGYRLLQARNGQEAVDLATQESPHLILMDIQMPEMNGLEAIQTLRQIPHLAALPIIALTALAMEGDRDRCLAAGATDYLSKPLQLKTLVAKIEELLIKTGC